MKYSSPSKVSFTARIAAVALLLIALSAPATVLASGGATPTPTPVQKRGVKVIIVPNTGTPFSA